MPARSLSGRVSVCSNVSWTNPYTSQRGRFAAAGAAEPGTAVRLGTAAVPGIVLDPVTAVVPGTVSCTVFVPADVAPTNAIPSPGTVVVPAAVAATVPGIVAAPGTGFARAAVNGFAAGPAAAPVTGATLPALG